MNALRNRVLLIGRLGQDPERFEFDGDKVKASLRLATNEVYRNAKFIYFLERKHIFKSP